MSIPSTERAELPARTHAQAAELLRRPFAPGAIGFRAMTKAPVNGDPFGGAQVAAYLGAQSVLQRLNAVVPGRWRQEFVPVATPAGSRRLYMACRLIITLPISEGEPPVDAIYEDVGEMESASRAGLKALYSDAQARRRRSRDRRLPVHGARAGRAADRTPRSPGPRDPAIRQARRADALAPHRAVVAKRLHAADEHRRGQARPRRDPRPRRARAWHGAGRSRRAGKRALAGADVLGRRAPGRPSASSSRA